MEYSDFYNIAEYLNEINRNTFTPREIAENAHIYCVDFQWSKENNEISFVIRELAKILAEDNSEECQDWLYRMATELNLIDLDYQDYLETDSWLEKFVN